MRTAILFVGNGSCILIESISRGADNPEGTMRTSITWSVLVLSVSIASIQTAGAQDAKRLFFEADMVRMRWKGKPAHSAC